MLQGINHINLAVSDLETAFLFYVETLGMKPLCRWPKGAYLLAGDLWLCLYQDQAHRPAQGYTHIAFSIKQQDFQHLSNKIKQCGARIWKENISEGDSLYFCDPDGHQLEIHVGDWQTRLLHKQKFPWPDTVFL